MELLRLTVIRPLRTPLTPRHHLLALMLLYTRPHLIILLNTNLLTRVELIQAPQIHRLVQKREDVFVETSSSNRMSVTQEEEPQ